jgi:hypothetical protein
MQQPHLHVVAALAARILSSLQRGHRGAEIFRDRDRLSILCPWEGPDHLPVRLGLVRGLSRIVGMPMADDVFCMQIRIPFKAIGVTMTVTV